MRALTGQVHPRYQIYGRAWREVCVLLPLRSRKLYGSIPCIYVYRSHSPMYTGLHRCPNSEGHALP